MTDDKETTKQETRHGKQHETTTSHDNTASKMKSDDSTATATSLHLLDWTWIPTAITTATATTTTLLLLFGTEFAIGRRL